MGNLYKGYVLSRGKVILEKYKGVKSFKSYDEVKDAESFAGILEDDVILIDIDEKEQSDVLFNIVKTEKMACRVYETSRGKHFLFKNDGIQSNKTHARNAIGLTQDIKIGSKNGTECLKIDGVERPILYDKTVKGEYQKIPQWLFPVNSQVDLYNLGEGDGRNDNLFRYILVLQSQDFSKEMTRETLRIINKYVFKEPLDDKELEIICRDEAFQAPLFFKDKTFLFDRFAIYLRNEKNIIKIDGLLHIYHDGVYVCDYKKIESEMIKLIPTLSKSKRKEVLDYLEILIQDNTKRSDARYIAFQNGVYDVTTFEFLPFDPSYVITNRIDHRYNEEAYSEIADTVLDRLTCNDKQLRMILEEVIGYTFYRRNELRKAFVLLGDKANGKSTYLDMIKNLLGDNNTSALDLNELGDRFKTAELHNKLANIGDDIGDMFIANPAVFKKLVSGDRINAERKGQDPFDFNNYSKFLFSANDMPRIKDKTGAVINRLIMIPFNARFDKDSANYDPFIKYKLQTEECMEYLIQIGLDGLQRVLENQQFTMCDKIQKEIDDYNKTNNPILLFLDIYDNDLEGKPARDVYGAYCVFCDDNKYLPMSNIEFSRQIHKMLNLSVVSKTVKGKKGRVFVKDK